MMVLKNARQKKKKLCQHSKKIVVFLLLKNRYIDDVYVGDYKKLLELETSGELDKLLHYKDWEGGLKGQYRPTSGDFKKKIFFFSVAELGVLFLLCAVGGKFSGSAPVSSNANKPQETKAAAPATNPGAKFCGGTNVSERFFFSFAHNFSIK